MVKIGKILKRKGFENEIIISMDIQEDVEITISKLPFLFIELQIGSKIPHRLLEIHPINNQQFSVIFDRIEEEKEINAIIGKDLWLPSDYSHSLITSEWFDSPVIGFKVWNHDQLVGEIIDVYVVDPQTLLSVKDHQEQEILIPLVEHWILSVDTDHQNIVMNLPEGLLSIED